MLYNWSVFKSLPPKARSLFSVLELNYHNLIKGNKLLHNNSLLPRTIQMVFHEKCHFPFSKDRVKRAEGIFAVIVKHWFHKPVKIDQL